MASGWYGGQASDSNIPFGVSIGTLGTDSAPLIDRTRWVAGSEVEVAWGINANHGGGYQYRLCPANSDLSEECFQQTPLAFVGDVQWLQYGWGMDRNNRTEIPAIQVGGDRVIPANSFWRRNPVPSCKNPTGGAYNGTCTGPAFDPPAEGAWGYGVGSVVNGGFTPDEILAKAFHFGVVDKVVVPDVPPGDYVLQFRWDAETFAQVWNSCADVSIVSSGANTKPFSATSGCHACCPETKSLCSNCTGCLNDKTGACAYCWEPLSGYTPTQAPPVHCLGFEAEDGSAPEWNFGDAEEGWSPGCPKCWADQNACKPHFRALDDAALVV